MKRGYYGSQFDGASVTATSGKWTINGAYGYMTAGRFKKADKEKNGDAGVVNVSVEPNKNFVLGAMYARTGSANVKMANGKKIMNSAIFMELMDPIQWENLR